MDYNAALAFVRGYSAEVGDTYDANGVVHLLLAAMDNLSEHLIDADLDQLVHSATADQLRLLIKIGRHAERQEAVRSAAAGQDR
jgi:hypothetical protein